MANFFFFGERGKEVLLNQQLPGVTVVCKIQK